jgi:hypothetical protein
MVVMAAWLVKQEKKDARKRALKVQWAAAAGSRYNARFSFEERCW